MTALSLFELNQRVRAAIEQQLDDTYWVEAEIAEARLAQNGHFYLEFIQKDASGRSLVARARAVMWARTYHLLSPLFERSTGERLRAGLKVRVEAAVEFHELYGLSLRIVDIDPAYTLGDMAQRRREILAQLEADGILEDNRSLSLPLLLKHIAVVSSAGAAGYGDFCDQLHGNEYGLYFDVQLFSATMQGQHVEASVMAALEAVANDPRWDCVVIIRGGGATSDLADFDSYPLAAAVAQMPIPVIVGIGHERDDTVLDYIAHTRVKTPTAAAAFIIDHGAQQLASLDEWQTTILQNARLKIEASKQQLTRMTTLLPRTFALVQERQQRRLEQLATRLTTAPRQQFLNASHRLELVSNRLAQAARMNVQNAKFKVQNMEQKLAALDPALLLQRGYSLTFTADGRLLRNADDIKANDIITTRLANGTVQSQVTWKKKQ